MLYIYIHTWYVENLNSLVQAAASGNSLVRNAALLCTTPGHGNVHIFLTPHVVLELPPTRKLKNEK